MEYASLIGEFAARYGIDGFATDENGAAGFEADGRQVVFHKPEDSDIALVTVVIGSAHGTDDTEANRILLTANRSLFATEGMSLAIHEETGRVLLLARLEVERLDFIGFDEKVARILERADQMGALLEGIGSFDSGAEATGSGDVGRSSVEENLMRV